MSRHISGEPDAIRVVSRKPLAQSAGCCLGCSGSSTQFASSQATICGRWLERLTSVSCNAGVKRKNPAAHRPPKCSTRRTAAAVRLPRGRDDAGRVHEQIRARRRHPGFFRARHRMTAHKMRAGPGNQCFQLAHDAGFDAAHVGHNGAAFHGRQHFQHARPHLANRRAKNDQVRVRDRIAADPALPNQRPRLVGIRKRWRPGGRSR